MACQGCRGHEQVAFDLTTAFQPIVDLGTGRAYAYEALVRGANGASAGEVLASVTDENRYAFDQACRVTAIREAVAAGLLETDAKLSINFMPNAVYSPAACIRLTLATAMENLLPLSRLVFEFTENEEIDADHLRSIIDAYRALGFETAIDDFGAGCTGLRLLAEFRTDALKIDMALVRGIEASRARRVVVGGIVRMCEELGVRVVAEGVETMAELAALQDLGVRYVQGYLFGRPQVRGLPAVDLGALVRGRVAA